MVEEWVWRCGKEEGRGVGVKVWEGERKGGKGGVS